MASSSEHVTQIEMNQLALESYTRSSEKLIHVFDELKSKLEPEQVCLYEASQSAWEIYSKEQALAVASMYEGGSIYALIYHSELETLAHDRTARIQIELDELVRISN